MNTLAMCTSTDPNTCFDASKNQIFTGRCGRSRQRLYTSDMRARPPRPSWTKIAKGPISRQSPELSGVLGPFLLPSFWDALLPGAVASGGGVDGIVVVTSTTVTPGAAPPSAGVGTGGRPAAAATVWIVKAASAAAVPACGGRFSTGGSPCGGGAGGGSIKSLTLVGTGRGIGTRWARWPAMACPSAAIGRRRRERKRRRRVKMSPERAMW